MFSSSCWLETASTEDAFDLLRPTDLRAAALIFGVFQQKLLSLLTKTIEIRGKIVSGIKAVIPSKVGPVYQSYKFSIDKLNRIPIIIKSEFETNLNDNRFFEAVGSDRTPPRPDLKCLRAPAAAAAARSLSACRRCMQCCRTHAHTLMQARADTHTHLLAISLNSVWDTHTHIRLCPDILFLRLSLNLHAHSP